jgi:hypothetical protein
MRLVFYLLRVVLSLCNIQKSENDGKRFFDLKSFLDPVEL